MAIVAVVLSCLGLILTLANVAVAIYLIVSGQHPLMPQMKAQ
jgi:hypothetical protein